jgi:hypothetical protein
MSQSDTTLPGTELPEIPTTRRGSAKWRKRTETPALVEGLSYGDHDQYECAHS